ncbi:MAG: OB-fold domain-containing protein [Chloroflexi bacterium]|nr:OB-fold domain-containing protein [Chloroflexota bacterium]MDA1146003.1 OB-fold domain-containing protein [Chloroflexota bacterium]
MTRPTVTADEASAPFFDGAARGALMLQRCRTCSQYAFPIQEVCTNCLEADLEWAEASGAGTLHTFAVMHRLYDPGFAQELPYNVAIVELAEGPRMNARIDAPNEEIKVGMALQVAFEPSGDVQVPVFKPA